MEANEAVEVVLDEELVAEEDGGFEEELYEEESEPRAITTI